LRNNFEQLEDEANQTKQNYSKLYTQYTTLQSQNDYNLREIEDLRKLISELENERIELRQENQEL